MKATDKFCIYVLSTLLLFTAGCASSSSAGSITAGENETLITVERRNESVAALRYWNIYVDGKLTEKVGNGKSVSFTVPRGEHSIYTEIDEYESNVIMINAETKAVRFSTYITRAASSIDFELRLFQRPDSSKK
jgi:hypothetical protein